MRKLLAFFIGFLVANFVSAQHPFSTKWEVLKTSQVKVIYPNYLACDAFRIANSMQKVFEADTVTLSAKTRRAPLLVSTTSTVSNGYATLMPYKLCFYSKPADDFSISSNEWFQSLCVHEYRHIVQYSAINKGLTKFASCIFGAYGRSTLSYSIPAWFFEGDAVYAETELTSQGRGRVPNFERLYASILCSRPTLFKYDKALYQSYRDYLPNRYPLGYMMVTNARRNFGADIFENTFNRSCWYSFWPFAFGTGFHHFTGQWLGKQYVNTFNDLKTFYSKRLDSAQCIEYKHVNTSKKKFYTDYSCPKFINDTLLLCIKKSLSKSNRFVLLKVNGSETCLKNTDADVFDSNGEIAVYTTDVPDLRWTLRNYSDLVVFDLKTFKTQIVTTKQRYFSPTISDDGSMVAVVEFKENRECSLVVLKLDYEKNKYSSTVIASLPAVNNEYFRYLKFVGGNRVAFVSNYDGKNSIKVWNFKESSVNQLVKDTYDNIGQLNYSDGKILYVSDYTGIENVFEVPVEGGQSYQLTNSKFGVSFPVMSDNGKYLCFSDFSSLGNDISIISNVQRIDTQKPIKLDYFQPLMKYENAQSLDFIATLKPDTTSYKSQKYSQFNDPVRIYGWLPDAGENYVQATINSENTLGTLAISANEYYNLDFDYFRTNFNVKYSGFYPVISLSASLGENSDNFLIGNQLLAFVQTLRWHENVFKANLELPFNFSRYNFSQKLSIVAGFLHYNLSGKLINNYTELGNGNFPVFNSSLSYSWDKDAAYRDFRNPLSFNFAFSYKEALKRHLDAQILSTSLGFTIPGFFSQNYFSVKGTYICQTMNQRQDKVYLFANSDMDVRGYESIRLQKMRKLSADYAFPMGYPDFGIPGVFWITRFRGYLYGDFAEGEVFRQKYKFASAGFKILADFHVLRLSTNLLSGFSVSRGFRENGLECTEFGFVFSYSM